jgi:hypothetical protein
MQERDGMASYGMVCTAVQYGITYWYGVITCDMVRSGVVWSDVVCVL